MREMAVIKIATSVRRTKLMLSRQDHGVAFREFYANTRAAAATCKYKIKCPHDCCVDKEPVDYTQAVVKDILLAGMSDADIRREVLGLAELDMKSAKELVAIVEEKEVARDACFDTVGIAAGTSSYQRYKSSRPTEAQDDLRTKLARKGKCEKCGSDFNLYTKFASGRINQKPFKFCASCFKSSKASRTQKKAPSLEIVLRLVLSTVLLG